MAVPRKVGRNEAFRSLQLGIRPPTLRVKISRFSFCSRLSTTSEIAKMPTASTVKPMPSASSGRPKV